MRAISSTEQWMRQSLRTVANCSGLSCIGRLPGRRGFFISYNLATGFLPSQSCNYILAPAFAFHEVGCRGSIAALRRARRLATRSRLRSLRNFSFQLWNLFLPLISGNDCGSWDK